MGPRRDLKQFYSHLSSRSQKLQRYATPIASICAEFISIHPNRPPPVIGFLELCIHILYQTSFLKTIHKRGKGTHPPIHPSPTNIIRKWCFSLHVVLTDICNLILNQSLYPETRQSGSKSLIIGRTRVRTRGE